MSNAERSVKTYKAIIVALAGAVIVLLAVIAQMGSLGATATPARAGATATVTVTAPAPEGEQQAAPEQPSLDAQQVAEQERFLVETLPRRQAQDPLAKGRVDATVVLTEWADYRCPFCSVWAEETLPHLQKFIDDGTLRVEFRDLALFGDESIRAATAARAAGAQGRYFEFQQALFAALPNEGHPDIPDDLVLGIAADLDLDVAAFTADWADPALEEAVLADSSEAQQFGIGSTPSFVIGSQFVSGAQPLGMFERIITEQAALHG